MRIIDVNIHKILFQTQKIYRHTQQDCQEPQVTLKNKRRVRLPFGGRQKITEMFGKTTSKSKYKK